MELLIFDYLTKTLVYSSILATFIYLYFSWCYGHWKRRNFPFLKPNFPKGNNPTYLARFPGPHLECRDHYLEIRKRGLKFAGIFSVIHPILVVVDPVIIKDILVKDFEHFVDRGFYSSENDPLSVSLLSMGGDKWKNSRGKLTNFFTIGKVKMLIPLMVGSAKPMVRSIGECALNNTDSNITLLTKRYAAETVGTCFLGIDCNNFGDAEDTFANMVGKFFRDQNFTHLLRVSCTNRFPALSRKVGLKLILSEVSEFFKSAVRDTLKYREEHNYFRPDVLQLLINLKKEMENTSDPITEEQVAAHIFSFFVAGIDTIADLISFTLYELCRNPDIQERVREEIMDIMKKHKNEFTPECLNDMKYLRQVISETLRIYPGLPSLERECVKDYKINGTNLTIEKGTTVWISIMGIHRDPEYHTDPEKFDPDRFIEDSAKSYSQFYFPFGLGPRMCIGVRFGLTVAQIGLIKILREHRMSLSDETCTPLKLNKQSFLLETLEPLLMRAEKI
nr:probable cytochrome P450 6a13 [Leptinotarsa decemlineata]